MDKDPNKKPIYPIKKNAFFNFSPHIIQGKKDGDDDEGGSGGKKEKLTNQPVESAKQRSKFIKEKEDSKQNDQDKKLETNEEKDKKSKIEALQQKHYLQKMLNPDFAFDATNISPSQNIDAAKYNEAYARASAQTAVSLGVQPTILEQQNYVQILGSITTTIIGPNGKSIMSMEDAAPIQNWHTTQYFNPHATSWFVSMLFNPHSPARWYTLTGAVHEAVNAHPEGQSEISGGLFQSKKPTPSIHLTNNPYSGFNRSRQENNNNNEMADYIRNTWLKKP